MLCGLSKNKVFGHFFSCQTHVCDVMYLDTEGFLMLPIRFWKKRVVMTGYSSNTEHLHTFTLYFMDLQFPQICTSNGSLITGPVRYPYLMPLDFCYMKNAVCFPPLPTTLSYLSGRFWPLQLQLHLPCSHMCELNLNTDMMCARLHVVPSLNICKQLSVGHKTWSHNLTKYVKLSSLFRLH
jgi:hypothetical protein